MPTTCRAIQFVPTSADLSGFSELMGFHRHLLNDQIRTEAFLNAIAQRVKPGDVVIDLGTGSGILAMAACRAGASKVYAIEYGRIVDLARALARQNGLADRIEFFAGDSRDFHIPRRADVIVSECLGFMGIGGNMTAAFSDLIGRCLRPGGTVIPDSIRSYMAPVESDLHFDYVHCWREQYGFDFSPAQRLASNNLYVATFCEDDFISKPQQAASVGMLSAVPDEHVDAQLSFTTTRPCRMHGYCGWFETTLCDGLTLSSSPAKQALIWQQLFLPLESELHLDAGACIQLSLSIAPRSGRVPVAFNWRTRATDAGGATRRFKQGTNNSFPSSLQHERRT